MASQSQVFQRNQSRSSAWLTVFEIQLLFSQPSRSLSFSSPVWTSQVYPASLKPSCTNMASSLTSSGFLWFMWQLGRQWSRRSAAIYAGGLLCSFSSWGLYRRRNILQLLPHGIPMTEERLCSTRTPMTTKYPLQVFKFEQGRRNLNGNLTGFCSAVNFWWRFNTTTYFTKIPHGSLTGGLPQTERDPETRGGLKGKTGTTEVSGICAHCCSKPCLLLVLVTNHKCFTKFSL